MNPRTAHSKRAVIAEVIARRVKSGEALTVRQILKESGGGSSTTVLEELAKLDPAEHRIQHVLTGSATSSSAEQIRVLKEALAAALQREEGYRAEAAALKALVLEMTTTYQFMVSQHDDTYREMVMSLDTFRQAAKMVPQLVELSKRPAPEPKVKVETDILLQARYNARVAENGQLHQRIRELEEKMASLEPRDDQFKPDLQDPELFEQ